MKKKPITARRKDGTVYYAWTAEELASALKLLVSLNYDAHKYYNHYLDAKKKDNKHQMQCNLALLRNVKEMIDRIKNELTKDY